MVTGFFKTLYMLDTDRRPTHGINDAYSVGTPNGACGVRYGQTDCKTKFSSLVYCGFLVSKRTIFFFWGLVIGMLYIGRARHPGPRMDRVIPGSLSVEFANIGGWLTNGDLALDSCAQFLAVAEHKLIPARVRSVGHQLRVAGSSLLGLLLVKTKLLVVMPGVGVVSLGGAPLACSFFSDL